MFDTMPQEAESQPIEPQGTDARAPGPAAASGTDDPPFADGERRWQAVCERDGRADGFFVYAVTSTGVFCRPSCPSRPKRRENVLFFADSQGAARAGFRACRRCRPDGLSPQSESARRIADACRAIEAAETPPSLAQLAKLAGLAPHHFHRCFKRFTGLTPRDYAQSVRERRLREALHAGESVTAAIYGAGYNAPSRFYASAGRSLGMAPARFRKGGLGERVIYTTAPTPLGTLIVGATDRGICAIALGDDAESLAADLNTRFPGAERVEADATLGQALGKILDHLAEPNASLDLPLDVRGTAFQRRVWNALSAIPPGQTRSYTDIAAAIGTPAAVRAVARACASNEHALAVPCHRVVRADGTLAGYRWGMDRKRALLERERAAAATPEKGP